MSITTLDRAVLEKYVAEAFAKAAIATALQNNDLTTKDKFEEILLNLTPAEIEELYKRMISGNLKG